MTSRRVLACVLIAIQTLCFWVMSGAYVLSGAALAAALLGCRGRFQWPMPSRRRLLLGLGVMLLFAVKWRLSPPLTPTHSDLPFFGVVLDYNMAFSLAQGLLVWQVLLLFVRHEAGLPPFYPLLSALGLTLLGNIPLQVGARGWLGGSRQLALFMVFSLGLTAATAFYFASLRAPVPGARMPGSRTARRFAAGVVLLVALMLGVVSGYVVKEHGARLDRLVGSFAQGLSRAGNPGFSRTASLGSIASMHGPGARKTVLRIFADSPPGYLRGMVFDYSRRGGWECLAHRDRVGPSPAPAGAPRPEPDEKAFLLRPGLDTPAADYRFLRVHPEASLWDTVFTTLDTALLYAPVDHITLDPHGIPQAPQLPLATPYSLVAAPAAGNTPLPEGAAVLLTSLPQALDDRVRALADDLMSGCETDGEKIAAVTRFFAANFSYGLGISPPAREDPITWFLLERPPAHCEYFATGAAILLRYAGVPTRYVTGFLVTEGNPYGGYWVARNRDAHAWVEAYDSERGWVTVEATPSAGVPDGAVSDMAQLWDYLKHRIDLLREAFSAQGVAGLLAELGRLLSRTAGLAIRSPGAWAVLAASAVAAGIVYLRCRRGRRGMAAHATGEPLADAFRALLRRMDRRLKAVGLARRPAETLVQFARRVEDAGREPEARWYRGYSDRRYRAGVTVEALGRLREELERMRRPPRP